MKIKFQGDYDLKRAIISSTMPYHFASFTASQNSPGLILIEQNLPIREAIEDLLLIWETSEAEEWVNKLEFIPL